MQRWAPYVTAPRVARAPLHWIERCEIVYVSDREISEDETQR